MTGLGYNVDTVRARLGAATPDSWALLLDPVHTAKLKARITNAVYASERLFGFATVPR
jgi:spermidine/putrescine-binding protein